jgi:hypothetical protein
MRDTPRTHGGCTKVRLKGSAAILPGHTLRAEHPESININRGKVSLSSLLSSEHVPSMRVNFYVNLNSTCGVDYLGLLLYCSV